MPTETMMTLGGYAFSLDSVPVDELERISQYRWRAAQRIGVGTGWQWLGPGEETIRFSGVGFPAWRGGARQADAMRSEAAAGRPLRLMDGSGRVLGWWVIRRIEERRSDMLAGAGPRRIKYRLELALHSEMHGPDRPREPAEDSGVALMGAAAEADFRRIELLPAEVQTELKERLSAIDKARELMRQGASRPDALEQVSGQKAQELYELLDKTGLGSIPRRLWGPSQLLSLAPDLPADPRDSAYARDLLR